MRNNSFELVDSFKDKIESNTFDKQVYDVTGVFIMRNVIPQDVIKEWQDEWNEFYTSLGDKRNVHLANPVELKENLPAKLSTMYRNEVLVNTAKLIHGEDVALYNHRFVIKDKFSLDKVMLHNDACYHLGYLNKCSFFVPLSISNKDNGGLTFHLGTHKYGYLGDAGEINPNAFDIKWPKVTPELNPGDFAIMNSSVWHESGPNVAQIDRIVADIHYQPANDPTGKELLSGEWKTDFFYAMEDPTKYFINSRILKIRNK